MTESGELRLSISLLEPCRFFTFAKHVSFEHSMGSSRPMITSRRERNINKQTKLKISSHSIVDRSVRFALPVFGRSKAASAIDRLAVAGPRLP